MKADDVVEESSINTSCIGFVSNAHPEIKQSKDNDCSAVGESTNSVPKRTAHWYALRTTYGQEKKAYEYIISHNGTAFYPTIIEQRIIKGKRKSVEKSRLPNIFFAFGTEEEIQTFVYDNVNLPYLRFYYNYHREGNIVKKTPLIVPDSQMESFRIICEAESNDIIILPESVQKFKEGQEVRITSGSFAGVEGRVARFCGQQRVAVIINGLFTIATAYIPSAFLEKN